MRNRTNDDIQNNLFSQLHANIDQDKQEKSKIYKIKTIEWIIKHNKDKIILHCHPLRKYQISTIISSITDINLDN